MVSIDLHEIEPKYSLHLSFLSFIWSTRSSKERERGKKEGEKVFAIANFFEKNKIKLSKARNLKNIHYCRWPQIQKGFTIF